MPPSPTKNILLLAFFFFIFVLLPLPTTAYRLQMYTGQKCTGQALGEWTGGPRQGCQRTFAGLATSVNVKDAVTAPRVARAAAAEEAGDFAVVFFRADNCDPRTEILRVREGCAKPVGYRSFAVRNMGRRG